MKTLLKFLFLSAALVALPSAPASAAQGEGLGLGVLIGSPSALTLKYRESSEVAYDAGLAFDLDDYFLLYADYLIHFPRAFKSNEKFVRALTPYFGAGPLVAFADNDYERGRKRRYFDDEDEDVAFGVRIPVGIEWLWDKHPLGIAVELAPGITIFPATDAFFQGGVAVRWYL